MKLNLFLISLVVLPLFATPLYARGGGGGGGGHGHGRVVVVVPRVVPSPFGTFGTNRTFFVTRSSTVNRGLVPPLAGPSLNGPPFIGPSFNGTTPVRALTLVNTGNGVFVTRGFGGSRGATVLVNTGDGNFVTQTTPTSGFFRFSNGSLTAIDSNQLSGVTVAADSTMKSKVIAFE